MVGGLGEEIGLPVPITLLLSGATGMSVAMVGTKVVFKNAAGEVLENIEGGKDSSLGNMSFEDGKQYSSWSKIREEGLSLEQVEKIKATPKGQKPLPETYLSEEYINNHLDSFKKNGAVKIMPSEPSGTIGGKGGTFVMSGDELNEIIQNANGDVSKMRDLNTFYGICIEPHTYKKYNIGSYEPCYNFMVLQIKKRGNTND